MADPEKVLQCILEAQVMNGDDAKKKDQVQRRNKYTLPNDAEVQKITNVFKRQDPSEFYEVVKRINAGAQGLIFHVKRLSDQKDFALKFLQPKDESDYKNIKNEVALMMLC